jgi:glutathione S-transferase
MEYVSVAEAKLMSGMRLVLSAGVPGPWGEAAKGIFHVKGLDYVPVFQEGAGENAELAEWTGQNSAPVALYNNEVARCGYLDILFLAERLAPTPSLIPTDVADRILVLGLSRELAGESGFAWCRRLTMLAGAGIPLGVDDPSQRLSYKYGLTPEAVAAAPQRVIGILDYLSSRLHAQKAHGSDYFVGAEMTAVDIYWACFASLLRPLPHDVNPMPDFLREVYQISRPEELAAADEILFTHRAMMYDRHLVLPLDF